MLCFVLSETCQHFFEYRLWTFHLIPKKPEVMEKLVTKSCTMYMYTNEPCMQIQFLFALCTCNCINFVFFVSDHFFHSDEFAVTYL